MATNFDRTKQHPGLPPPEILNSNYKPLFPGRLQKEEALDFVKTNFETNLKNALHLTKISCPMFVTKSSGFNDNLNGVERPATFSPRDFEHVELEVPFSLAKWKRWATHHYGIQPGSGLVCDFRGLRCDDDCDYTHSLAVDQWDWEKVITDSDRTFECLQTHVKGIYKALYDTEQALVKRYGIKPALPETISFVSTEQVIEKYPNLSPKEREHQLCRDLGAVFLMGIGGTNDDGNLRHDGRAPDYDDWVTQRPDGGKGLNGDILVWSHVLQSSFELSSMGIRVNSSTMKTQLELCDATDRLSLPWHKMLLEGKLPQTIGGGIGQSRLCQFLLHCIHIGEVQHGWYNPEEVAILKQHRIHLLGLGDTVIPDFESIKISMPKHKVDDGSRASTSNKKLKVVSPRTTVHVQ